MRLPEMLTAGAAILLGPALPAAAHAGFLMPVLDDTGTSGEIILMATFSDSFPVEAIGLKSDHWTIVSPDGTRQDYDRIAETDTRSLLQATLTRDGTYRFSTGERLGRKGEAARVDGKLVRLGRDGMAKESLPEGTEILTAQTATVSDLYVAKGDPGAPPEVSIGRLEIRPATNPAGVLAGETMVATILFDGAPLAGVPVTYMTPTNSGEEGADDETLMTGPDGRVALSLESAGPHLLMIRHLADAPDGAETDVRSYTTVLTVVVG